MTRRIAVYIVVTVVLHVAIAVGSYAAMRWAEATGKPVFRNLVRGLVFADVPKYYEHANNFAEGMIPYRDDPIEYPLFALPFVFAPRLLAGSQSGFVALFAAEMLAFDALLVALVAWRIAGSGDLDRLPSRLAWLTAFFATVSPFVMGRYDAVPAVLGFAAACAWFSGRGALGGGLSALGALVKIVPGAVALPGIIGELMGWTRPRGRGTMAFGFVFLAGVAAWFAIGGSGVLDSIRYHSERQVEIGSVPAGVLWLVGWAKGDAMAVFQDHESLNLDAPGSYNVARLAVYVQAIVMLFVAWGFVKNRGRDPFRFAGAAVLAFALGGKVLSPQYLIWVMPFIAVQNGRVGRVARPVFLLGGILTMVLYPWSFRALPQLEPWAFFVLNARNGALVLLLAVLVLGSGDGEGSLAEPTLPSRLS
ncbi:MAG: putative rane protein [Planctomycetota bacterium]|nr:putative rane protein [Planctomycetota bacterium]